LPRVHQGFHVKVGAGFAHDARAVAALGPCNETADTYPPAELPGFAEGFGRHLAAREQNEYAFSGKLLPGEGPTGMRPDLLTGVVLAAVALGVAWAKRRPH
jgi:hypothetical protein